MCGGLVFLMELKSRDRTQRCPIQNMGRKLIEGFFYLRGNEFYNITCRNKWVSYVFMLSLLDQPSFSLFHNNVLIYISNIWLPHF